MHNAQCKMHNCGIFLAENAFKINFCLSYQPSSYIIVGADDHIRPLRVRSLSAAYGTMWSSSPTSGGALNRNLRYRIIIFNSQFSILNFPLQRKTERSHRGYSDGFSVCQKTHFDRLAEVKEPVKTSNATPKCMWILERGALRSKSKRLAEQALLQSLSFLLHKNPAPFTQGSRCYLYFKVIAF